MKCRPFLYNPDLYLADISKMSQAGLFFENVILQNIFATSFFNPISYNRSE